MGQDEQIGYFEIDHSDITTSEKIVPKDETGVSPQGEPNPDQNKYDISSDGESQSYYVHIVNDLDAKVDSRLLGSHMFDDDFSEYVELQSAKTAASDDEAYFSGDQNVSSLGVAVKGQTDPTSGKLKIIIQKSSV